MSATVPASNGLDALCIGNAIVDVFVQTDDATIDRLSLNKGAMTLIEPDRADQLYAQMGPAVETSGGSAANTAAGIASFGGAAAYVGKVSPDQLGEVFSHDIRAIGVEFTSLPDPDGPPTARSFIFVTPDAERTMNTYLGACVHLTPADIDPQQVARAAVTYMEGYLWDRDPAKAAFLRAAEVAHGAGRSVSLTLSDSFCVDRHRDSFLDLVRGHIDLLFANEEELLSLYQCATFDEGLQHVRQDCAVAALTRSEKGAVIVAGDEVHVIDAVPVADLVDTTGAGDQFAAGFLYGFTNGHGLAASGRLGTLAASEVIGHVGPRPAISLASLLPRL